MIFDIIFGLKLESDSVPFRTVVTGQNQKLYLFLVFYAIMLFHWMQSLNYLGDKPFSTWHGAVYFFGAQKLISNPRFIVFIYCLLHLLCNLFMLLLNLYLKHPGKRAVPRLRFEQCIHQKLYFLFIAKIMLSLLGL